MHLKFTAPDALFVDKLPAGSAIAWLVAHPEHAEAWRAALVEFITAESALLCDGLQRQLVSAQAALDQLRAERDTGFAARDGQLANLAAVITARDAALAEADTAAKAATARFAQLERRVAELVGQYEPKPYFQVHALPAPFDPKLRAQWAEVTHVGCRRPPEIGGSWTVDLLREMETNQFARVATGVEIPAASKLTSYTEVDGDIFAEDLAAWFTVQNTPAPSASRA